MRYKAFISYSHADEASAVWLHNALERFRIPRHLRANRHNPRGLAPIFRDRAELGTSSDLSDSIRDALVHSECLIVICSPDAAVSEWVDREVAEFLELGRKERILYCIAEGNPPEVFPPSAMTGGEPLAADLQVEGRRNALLKLAAGILDIGYDELRQRDAGARNRRLAGIAVTSVAGMVLTTVLAVFALIQQQAAERERQRAEESVVVANQAAERSEKIARFLRGIFEVTDPEKAARETTLADLIEDSATRIEDAFPDQPDIGTELLLELGTNSRVQGDMSRAGEMFEMALSLSERKLGKEHDLYAESLMRLGRVRGIQSKTEEGVLLLRESLELRRRLLGDHVNTADTLGSLATTMVELRTQTAHREALELIAEADAMYTRLDVPDTSDRLVLQFIAGRILIAEGQYEQALHAFKENLRRQEAIDGRLGVRGIINRDVAYALLQLGRYEESERHVEEALALYTRISEEPTVDVAFVLQIRSLLEWYTGRAEQAIVSMLRVSRFATEHLGAESELNASSERWLAEFYLESEQAATALSYAERALEHWRATHPAEDPYVGAILSMRGRVHLSLGDRQTALVDAEAGYRSAHADTAEQDPVAVSTLLPLAEALLANGRPKEALSYADRAREAYQRRGRGSEGSLARAQAIIGKCQYDLGAREQAIASLKQAHTGLPNLRSEARTRQMILAWRAEADLADL